MNSQLSNVISPAQFSSSWLLCFHDITWPLLSWNSLLSSFLMILCLHGSFLTSLFRFRLIFPLPKSRQAPSKCPVRGHLLFISPFTFIFLPIPSTISLMLMSPKSVLWTVAWVVVSHFQLPLGNTFTYNLASPAKLRCPSIPYHTGVDSPSTLPLA